MRWLGDTASRLRISPGSLLRGILIGTIPWAPAYLFERATFFFEVNRDPLYWVLTGARLEADVVSFALGGILIAHLLRARLAIIQIFLSTVLTSALFYQVCQTFRSGGGWFSECYLPGPDGLSGYRLGMMMFSFGALPSLVGAASGIARSTGKWRPMIAVFAGIVVSVVVSWFPMTAWFSGASYIELFLPIQATVVFGLPEIACGVLAARVGRSVWIAAVAGVLSLLYLSSSLWTLLCPGCDRSLLILALPLWGLFAFLGGILELGVGRATRLGASLAPNIPGLRRVALAAVITVSLWTLVAYSFWEPSVLYASSVSTETGPLYLGLPIYRPYVAGYYNSTQYRICCLEIGVSLSRVDTSVIGPGNFLMAGMGVQSPNCCVDGWDFGWRADVFVLSNGTLLVSGSSWETCDANANCGGHMWQHLMYHTQRTISPPDRASLIFLRMMWEAGQVNWYYNYTGLPWQLFGGFTPDWREGRYFDIGVIGPGHGLDLLYDTYFFQFGVASESPIPGWTVRLLYPGFQFQGSWRLMERAAVIQGPWSYWKGAYRWGGAEYSGVTARGSALDPSFPRNLVEFSYTGGSVGTNTPLW